MFRIYDMGWSDVYEVVMYNALSGLFAKSIFRLANWLACLNKKNMGVGIHVAAPPIPDWIDIYFRPCVSVGACMWCKWMEV